MRTQIEGKLSTRRPPRKFEEDWKREVVAEGAQTSYHGAALRHDLLPSQVFKWRKQFSEQASAADQSQAI